MKRSTVASSSTRLLGALVLLLTTVQAFVLLPPSSSVALRRGETACSSWTEADSGARASRTTTPHAVRNGGEEGGSGKVMRGLSSRPGFIKGGVAASSLAAALCLFPASPALADTPTKLEPLVLPSLEGYSDPEGVFKLQVPKGWFTKRKGDRGREGIIFISGDFKQAVTMSIEIIHMKDLFRQSGIQPTGLEGSLKDWSLLGSASGMAGLLASHKEVLLGPGGAADKSSVYTMVPDSVGAKGQELKFDFTTDIRVQRPDLLMEELGEGAQEAHEGQGCAVGEGDKVVVAWAGAMSKDWDRGYGGLLDQVVDSVAILPPPPPPPSSVEGQQGAGAAKAAAS